MATEILDAVINAQGAAAGAAQFEGAANRVVRSANFMERAVQRTGRILVGFFGVRALARGVSQTVSAFADYEAGITAVAKTTGLAGTELDRFSVLIGRTAERIPVATSRLQEIAAVAGQLGTRGTDNILTFTRTLAKLETATDIQGEQGALQLQRLLNVTQNTGVQSAANVLVRLGNETAARESEILEVATKVGQAGSVFKITATEALALGSAFKSMGVEAELAGSATFRLLSNLRQMLRLGGDAARQIEGITGQSSDDLLRLLSTDRLTFLTTVLGSAVRATGDPEEGLRALGVSNVRDIRALGPVAANLNNLAFAARTATDELKRQAALGREFALFAGTARSELQLLRNEFAAVSREIGERLTPVVLKLGRGFLDLLTILQRPGVGRIEAPARAPVNTAELRDILAQSRRLDQNPRPPIFNEVSDFLFNSFGIGRPQGAVSREALLTLFPGAFSDRRFANVFRGGDDGRGNAFFDASVVEQLAQAQLNAIPFRTLGRSLSQAGPTAAAGLRGLGAVLPTGLAGAASLGGNILSPIPGRGGGSGGFDSVRAAFEDEIEALRQTSAERRVATELRRQDVEVTKEQRDALLDLARAIEEAERFGSAGAEFGFTLSDAMTELVFNTKDAIANLDRFGEALARILVQRLAFDRLGDLFTNLFTNVGVGIAGTAGGGRTTGGTQRQGDTGGVFPR